MIRSATNFICFLGLFHSPFTMAAEDGLVTFLATEEYLLWIGTTKWKPE